MYPDETAAAEEIAALRAQIAALAAENAVLRARAEPGFETCEKYPLTCPHCSLA
jgi:hypothetical protein